jgi:copper chaperone CopZ
MEGKKYLYEFHVGMTCDGCSNAVRKLLSSETYLQSFDISVPDKLVKAISSEDGVEQRVLDRLTKWATASKKELEFKQKTEITE